MTRCQPGDLCVVVNANAYFSYLLGAFVTVTKQQIIRGEFGPEVAWKTDPIHLTNENLVILFNDRALRPIRPQPDDAQDLLLAPLPAKEKV